MNVPENNSVVRPEYFFIIGLSGISNSNYYYIFLFVAYFIALAGNSVVIIVIALERSLHTPKYIGVFNLALADFGEANALIPNMMKTFLFDSQYISYKACFANMFFVNYFITVQSVTLVVLAFDRVVAICLPLRYHTILSNLAMSIAFSAIWTFNTFMVAITVSLVTRLSICKSNVIESYYCDYGPMMRLACNDRRINEIITLITAIFFLLIPLIIIALSYIAIFIALTKITTWDGRLKALKTCVSHLLLVGIYFLPVISIYILSSTTALTANFRIISTSLSFALPPAINPIIYVLNTAEIKDIIRKKYLSKSLNGCSARVFTGS